MPRPQNPKTREGEAIAQAIASSPYTQAELAEILDVSPGFISQCASGHRPMPWEKAMAMAQLIGVEPEKISQEYRKIKDHFTITHHEDNLINSEMIEVISYEHSAGLGKTCQELLEAVEAHVVMFPRELLGPKYMVANTKKLRLIHGEGDSMEPSINDGDSILFDLSDITPKNLSIYVIAIQGSGACEYNVKRCLIGSDKRVYFVADNLKGDHNWKMPRWKDDEANPISVIGKVKWFGRPLS